MINQINIVSHKAIPETIYSNKKNFFIFNLINWNEKYLFDLIKKWYETNGFMISYSENDFRVNGFRLAKEVGAINIEFPYNGFVGSCARCYILHSMDKDFSLCGYFCSDIEKFDYESEKYRILYLDKQGFIHLIGTIDAKKYTDELELIKDEMAICYDYFVSNNIDYLRKLSKKMEEDNYEIRI